MAIGNRFGWHSGTLTCKDAKLRGDLYVQDDIVFSDVSAGVLGVTGGIDMSATTSAIGIKMTGGTFSTSAIQIGSSASNMSISSGQIPLDINTTTTDTSGTVTTMNVKHKQTANTPANQTEVLIVELETNYRTGDWANCIVGRIDYSSTGDAGGGMAAPICSELNYAPINYASASGGAYAVLDLEMNCPENFSPTTTIADQWNTWLNIGIWGNATAIAAWEDYGFLIRTDGFTAASGNIFSAGAHTARIRVEDSTGAATTRYLVMSTGEDHLKLGNCTTGVNLSGSMTTGILIDGASTTAISITGSATDGIKFATGTFTDAIEIAGGTVTNGINISGATTTGIALAGNATDAIKISGTTVADGIEISSACSAYGINISGACTTAGAFLASANKLMFRDSGLYINSSADGKIDIVVDTGGVIFTLGSNAYDKIQFGGGAGDWGTGAAGCLIDGTGWDWCTSTIAYATSGALATSCAAAYHAFTINSATQSTTSSFFGTWTELYLVAGASLANASNAAAVWGQVECGAGCTGPDQADGDFMAAGYFNFIAGDNFTTGSYVNGVRIQSEISTTGYTETASTWLAGLEVMTKSTKQSWTYGVRVSGSTTGVAVISDSTAANNALIGASLSKDLTNNAATGAGLSSTNAALDITSTNATSATADSVMTIGNSLVTITEANSNALAIADVYSGTLLALSYTATTTGSGTATSTAKAINIDYNLTQTAGTLTLDDTAILNIDFDISGGNITVASGTIDMIAIDMADASTVPSYGTVAMNGLHIDCNTLDVSDSSLTLSGINIVMPAAYGVATEYGIYVAGDGTTVALCSDAATAITVGGTVTTGLELGASTTGIHFTGAFTGAIDFADAAFTPDATRTNYAIGIGDRNDELTIDLANAASQNFDPIQIAIDLTATAGAPSSTSTVNGIYQLITHDTTAMTNLRIKCSDWTISTDANFQDAYVSQNELDIGSSVTAIGGEAFAVSAYLNAGTGTYTVNDRLAAFFAISSGTATVTGTYNVAQIMASANANVDAVLYVNCISTATPTNMVNIENDGTCTSMISFINDGTTTYLFDIDDNGADFVATGGATAGANIKKIKILVDGVPKYFICADDWS